MTRFSHPLLLALLLVVEASSHAATVVPLNDTGQTLCYDGVGTTVTCTTTGADDGRYGRDAANTAGALGKTGAGNAGFDFTKIANNGSTLAAGAALGAAATDWACTRDNVTGLTWEVKTTSGGGDWRDSAHTYTWYSADTASNGGDAGSLGADTCDAWLFQCNTADYVTLINVMALCGYTDWRMPSPNELQSLVDFNVAVPTIDATYFPNTQSGYYWSANNFSPSPASAWGVNFGSGAISSSNKTLNGYVRLVRGAQ